MLPKLVSGFATTVLRESPHARDGEKMPGKLDKFFASKDKKKAPKKEEKKDDDDNVALANEAGLDFGITGEFTGRTVKLTKEGAMYA